MALVVSEPTAEASSSTDGTSFAPLSAYTPTANALQVVFVAAAGTTAVATMTGGSLTWALRHSKVSGAGTTVYVFTAQAGGSPASCDPTFDCTGDVSTGVTMAVLEVTGHDQSSPVVQVGDGAANGTNPAITMPGNMNTNNAYLSAVGVNRAAPGYTEPGSWTLTAATGHSSPNSGMSAAYRVGGETGTSISWTGASGNYAGVAIEIAIAPAGATYTLTGQTGALSLTGNNGALKASRKLNGNTGALTLTGNNGALRVGRKLNGQTGALVLTGNNGALRASRKLVGQTGALVLTGNDGELTYTPAGPTYTLTGQTGALTLTGNNGALSTARKLVGQTGALTLTAGNATLTKGAAADEYAGFYVYWPAPKKRRKLRRVKRRKLNVIQEIATEVSERFQVEPADVTPFIRDIMQREARAEELQRKALRLQEEARKAREEAARIRAEEEAQARIKELIDEIGEIVKKDTIAKRKRLNALIATALEWL